VKLPIRWPLIRSSEFPLLAECTQRANAAEQTLINPAISCRHPYRNAMAHDMRLKLSMRALHCAPISIPDRSHPMEHQRLVDLRGLCCSAPVIKLTAVIKGMHVGEVLLAEADNASMRKDVPSYCKQTQHELLQHNEQDGLLRFWIRKTH
jgi:tRNA 2-thiouridine synthesizing protein A